MNLITSPSGLHDEPLYFSRWHKQHGHRQTTAQWHAESASDFVRAHVALALPCTSLLNQSSQHAPAVVLKGLLHREGAEGSLLSQQIHPQFIFYQCVQRAPTSEGPSNEIWPEVRKV